MSGDNRTGGAPIRVLLVGPSLDILGGQAVQAARLLTGLRDIEGLEVSFLPVNPRLPGPLKALQRVKYVRTLVTFPLYLASLCLRVWRADVVHAFSAGYWSFLLAPAPAILVARLLRRRVLLNYRTGEAEDHLRRHGRVVIPLMRLAHAIIVPSGYLVEIFGRYGLVAQAIANFVDLDQIPYRERTQVAPNFLCNRNFEAHYNVACVIRAFAKIQDEYPEATLALVGEGSERTTLETLVRSLSLRAVAFAGSVHPHEMGGHYDRADCYLNAPEIDNMPTSVIEAFAAGLPVVSTDAGGTPWIVRSGQNGLLVSRNDDAALADSAIRLLREDGLVHRLTNTARNDVIANYTWDAVAPHWYSAYRDLFAHSGRN